MSRPPDSAACPEGRVGGRPLVIAHRGASGCLPEHTLAAYAAAIAMGADVVEPDLVMTRDGALIARHENALAVVDAATGAVTEATTNVHTLPRFASRACMKVVDGRHIAGWFAEDFTLAEIRTLRARERIPALRIHNTMHDDRYPIPTLQEIIDLAKQRSRALGRPIGIYPETKHPSYHAAIGLPLEPALVAVLAANGWNGPDAPVFIQSFETANLRALRNATGARLVQLLELAGAPWDLRAARDTRSYADLATTEGLRSIAEYADGIGPDKRLVMPTGTDDAPAPPSGLVQDAHLHGLFVHAWTFRVENCFLPPAYRCGREAAGQGDLQGEITAFLRTGMDGFFTDHADAGVAAVRTFVTSTLGTHSARRRQRLHAGEWPWY